MNKPDVSYTISMKGTFTKQDGLWRVQIPVADFFVGGESILQCLAELDQFIKVTSNNNTVKFTVRIQDGGQFSVCSNDYQAFIEFITSRLISSPSPKEVIKGLVNGITIDIGF